MDRVKPPQQGTLSMGMVLERWPFPPRHHKLTSCKYVEQIRPSPNTCSVRCLVLVKVVNEPDFNKFGYSLETGYIVT